MEAKEFRLLLAYLQRYFEIFALFQSVDSVEDEDGRVSKEEFLSAVIYVLNDKEFKTTTLSPSPRLSLSLSLSLSPLSKERYVLCFQKEICIMLQNCALSLLYFDD